MGVLDREKFFEAIQTRVGEDTSDEAIQFIEDMTDTYNDLEHRSEGDGIDWQARYNELDEKWKNKYKHRFFSGSGYSRMGDPDEPEEPEEKRDKITYSDLFTVKGER